jgi:RNA polymerase sigma-70 factor (ECF subfamily)
LSKAGFLAGQPIGGLSMRTEVPLLEAAKSMNREALIEIFDRYALPLYNYALRLCNDPLRADHIVGDVFAKLLDQWSSGHGPSSNLRAYLYETTYHLIVDESRSSRREAPLEVADFFGNDGPATLVTLENRMLFDAVVTAIKKNLTEDQRHVIILRFLEGFSLRETADIMGKEVYNVKVIQNRGVARIRKALGYKVAS